MSKHIYKQIDNLLDKEYNRILSEHNIADKAIRYTQEEFKKYMINYKITNYTYNFYIIRYDLNIRVIQIKAPVGTNLDSIKVQLHFENMTNKKCTKCNIIRPKEEYNPSSRTLDNLKTECKLCNMISSRYCYNKNLNSKYTLKEFKDYIYNTLMYDEAYSKWNRVNKDDKPILRYRNNNMNTLEALYITTKRELTKFKQNATEKRCSICKNIKPITNFFKCDKCISGYRSECKSCMKHVSNSRDNVIRGLYHSQIRNSLRRGHVSPNYTLDEFITWVNGQPIYDKLYREYVKSGFDNRHKPSGDRLDDSKPYTFDNLRLTTWKTNREKQYSITSVPIKVIDIKTNKETTYSSMNQVAIGLGISDYSVNVYNNTNKEFKGYKFYSNK